MSATARNAITSFVLTKMVGETVETRITLLRSLAAIEGNAKQCAQYHAVADALEVAEVQHQQLVLDFKRRSAG